MSVRRTRRSRRHLNARVPPQQHAVPSGAELAWCAITFGWLGIGLRAIDRCMGGTRVQELVISPAGVTVRPAVTSSEVRGAASRAETHGRSGHDAGCASLGIPLTLIDRALGEWDDFGASALLTEAIHEAVDEILENTRRSGVWKPDYARESLSYAIERRITPRAAVVAVQTAAGPH